MIRFTRLLHGKGTVSQAIKHRLSAPVDAPTEVLAFTDTRRPVIFWNITNKCNLTCSHCYINASPDAERPNELSTDECKAFIDDVGKVGVPLLLFTGGEPLVRPDFWELAAYAKGKGLRTVISTNGTLITEEVAQRLKDTGIQYVGVSLDGFDPKTHDHIRGQSGAFQRAIEGLKNCVEIGLKSGIRVTAHKSNYKEVPDIIDMAIELGVPRFCLYWLVPSGRGIEGYLENQLTEAQVKETLDVLYYKANEVDPDVIEILTVDAPQDGVYLLNRMKEENHPEYENAYKLLEMTGDSCSAGDRVANVDPVGNVYPCQFSQQPDYCVGNIRETLFSEMWNDPSNEVLNKFRAKKNNLKGICGVCPNKELCGGGCRIRGLNQHNDIWAEDSFCPYDLLKKPLTK
ncbi:MAG: radical SAM protein [Candidatus Bathyarchaeota archaeon]|nr:radical SAM protein [Candidatus Bathyarchaeota archaeon]